MELNLEDQALLNFTERFIDNPCRGLVQGMDEGGNLIQLSWIMGRSDNSQNRVYVVDGSSLRTKAYDETKVEDPTLIIYQAMGGGIEESFGGGERFVSKPVHIVSNGNQTDTIANAVDDLSQPPETSFYEAIKERYCEPDAPTFTPRISGIVEEGSDVAYFSILKADPVAREKWNQAVQDLGKTPQDFMVGSITKKQAQLVYFQAVHEICGLDNEAFPTVRQTFETPLTPGYGHCLTTYKPGSKELPTFEGEPFMVPLRGTLNDITRTFWDNLEPQWKVALGGKIILPNGKYEMAKPINRHGGD